ncbi:MAG: type II toxin-antitoxin system HicB family antitoxin [Mitsuokella sp.]|uniref:type II toxin-antitoxin system HicB family antitoxin n=1 Tax=Mitsuokella sp. TaxID=2049034 RepID=UPI003F0D25B1
MKNIDYYLSLPYRTEIYEDPEVGGYTVAIPELPGCLSCGETIDEAMKNIKDAKKAWLEAALEDGYPIPEPTKIESYSGQFKLRLPKSLHKKLAERAKREGISLNQYCVYLLSQNNALHA